MAELLVPPPQLLTLTSSNYTCCLRAFAGPQSLFCPWRQQASTREWVPRDWPSTVADMGVITIPAPPPQLDRGEAEELGGVFGFWVIVKAEPTGFADGLAVGGGEKEESRV